MENVIRYYQVTTLPQRSEDREEFRTLRKKCRILRLVMKKRKKSVTIDADINNEVLVMPCIRKYVTPIRNTTSVAKVEYKYCPHFSDDNDACKCMQKCSWADANHIYIDALDEYKDAKYNVEEFWKLRIVERAMQYEK